MVAADQLVLLVEGLAMKRKWDQTEDYIVTVKATSRGVLVRPRRLYYLKGRCIGARWLKRRIA